MAPLSREIHQAWLHWAGREEGGREGVIGERLSVKTHLERERRGREGGGREGEREGGEGGREKESLNLNTHCLSIYTCSNSTSQTRIRPSLVMTATLFSVEGHSTPEKTEQSLLILSGSEEQQWL